MWVEFKFWTWRYLAYPLLSLLQYWYVKFVAAAPLVVLLQDWGLFQEELIRITQLRVWAHIGVSIFVFLDFLAAMLVITFCTKEDFEPEKATQSFAKFLVYNGVVITTGWLANMGAPYEGIAVATKWHHLLWTFGILITEATSIIFAGLSIFGGASKYLRRGVWLVNLIKDSDIKISNDREQEPKDDGGTTEH